MAKINGQGGSCVVNSISLNVSNWELTTECDLADVTDTGSGGNQELLPTISKADYTLTCFVDATTLVANAAALQPGGSATINAVLTVGSSGLAYTVPGFVKTLAIKNPAKDPVEMTVSGSSSGSITLPS